MGLAILWVYFSHTQIYLPDFTYLLPIRFLKETGYGGVDIFLFISGYGLVHGITNNRYALSRFYGRRLSRILPAYWIVITLSLGREYLCGQEVTLARAVLQYSTMGFWLNRNQFDWYIPSLFMLYLFFPVFYQTIRDAQHRKKTVLLWITFSLLLCMSIIPTHLNYLIIILTRVPVFLLGLYTGLFVIQSGSVRHGYWPLSMILIIGFGSLMFLIIIFISFTPEQRWHYGLWWYPFLGITPCLCLILPRGLEKLRTSMPLFGSWFNDFLRFCGTHSLEIYLIHPQVFKLMAHLDPPITSHYWNSINKGHLLEYFIYFCITLVLALPIHRVAVIVRTWLT